MEPNETMKMEESATVGATMEKHDEFKWQCHTTLKKFHGDSTDEKDCYETVEIEGNSVSIGGVSAIFENLVGTAVGLFNNANAAIGVGDSTTANPGPPNSFADLQAATNKLRKGMDATYPQHTDSTSSSAAMTITYRSTFGTADANWVWAEWGVFNSVATSGTGLNRMLNRKVESLGTKVAGSTWQLTITLSIA